MAEPIRYRVDLSRRAQHLVGVTMTVPADLAPGARLVFPTWTPGSYVVRDYVHHVQRIGARGADGSDVVLRPDGTTAWRLPDEPGGAVTVELELYANELTPRTNHVDDHHALLVPPATFPYVAGAEQRRHLVHLPVAEDEPVHALLPEAAEPATWVAEDLGRLIDSAFEVGDHPTVGFTVAGVPHRFVWSAHGGRPAADRLAGDAAAVCGAAVELFGGDLPVDDYTFLCVGWDHDGGSGGLEHRDGATLMMPVATFQTPELGRRLHALIAHEYLHVWNVKRLTPAALVDLDYVTPAPSPSLWVAEGWTSYYDRLLPLRAGVWPLDHFLDQVASQVHRALRAPAARLQSVRDAGRQAWVKHYVRDENSVNSSVSYYGHGAVLAWCLDLMLRARDPGGDGLDEALRRLWDRFGATDAGYTERDVVDACEQAAGTSLQGFFDDHVGAAAPPPIHELVSAVGLRLVDADTAGPTPPWLGAQVGTDDGDPVLRAVLRDGPAWAAGLTGGDRLLAIDGLRVEDEQIGPLLAMHEPGDTVPVTVFRGPRLVTAPVTLADPRPEPRLVAVDAPGPDQRRAFRRWTGGHELGDVPAADG